MGSFRGVLLYPCVWGSVRGYLSNPSDGVSEGGTFFSGCEMVYGGEGRLVL